MLGSRIGLSVLAACLVSLTACSSMSLSPMAQEPTKIPVVYSYGPSGYYYDHGYGYYGYKHCYHVKGHHHHGKYVKGHKVCVINESNRGFWGCTGYIPAYAPEDRVCSKWTWMGRTAYPLYK